MLAGACAQSVGMTFDGGADQDLPFAPTQARMASSSTVGRRITATPAAASPASQAEAFAGPPDDHVIQHDRITAVMGAMLWGITAAKIVPAMTTSTNLQLLMAEVAILAVALAWPFLHPASYRRRRVPALVALRLLLICLPLNFDTHVHDMIVPSFDTGRLAWLSNLSNLFMGTNVLILIFPALGWRLAPRVHLPLQALQVAILMCFGTHAHCQTKLLSCPETAGMVGAVHTAANLVAEAFMPGASLADPKVPYTQTVALLLFWWVTAGFLLPTLLLLWPLRNTQLHAAGAAGEETRGQGLDEGLAHGCRVQRWQEAAAGQAVWAVDWLQHSLCSLLIPARQEQLVQQAGQAGALPRAVHAPLAARWLVLLLGIWLACCAAALLCGVPASS